MSEEIKEMLNNPFALHPLRGRCIMNTLRILFISLMLVISSFAVSSAAGIADIRIEAGLNLDWWEDNKDNHGSQVYAPVTISGELKDFSFSLLAAYAYTTVNESGGRDASLSYPLDTKLTLSYGIIGKLPVDILLGLDFNLPTGKTDLSKRQLALIMDPDLISINNFGEGFNINPTVTVAKEWRNWVGAMGFGYLWRGSYDFCSDLGITDYQPGEVYNVKAELRYFFSPALFARIFAGHAWYGVDTVEDEDSFQEGDYTELGLGMYYKQGEKWDAGLTMRRIFRDKSRFQGSPGDLVTEAKDSQGDELIVDLAARYLLNQKTALRSALQGRYFMENDYPSTSPFYVGKRQKVSLGVGVTRALATNTGVSFDVKGFYKHDDERNFPEIRSARDFWGYSVSLMLTSRF